MLSQSHVFCTEYETVTNVKRVSETRHKTVKRYLRKRCNAETGWHAVGGWSAATSNAMIATLTTRSNTTSLLRLGCHGNGTTPASGCTVNFRLRSGSGCNGTCACVFGKGGVGAEERLVARHSSYSHELAKCLEIT